ncbi:MAG: glycosyltransferase family 4 protein [Candidatus Promineifilaceae bacterium]
MTKTVFLSLVFAPDGVSTAVLMTELAQALQGKGQQVVVITTTPHYNVDPDARARQPLEKRWGGLFYTSKLDGVEVYHVAMPRKGSRVIGRIFDYLRFHLFSTLIGLAVVKKGDVLFVPTPPLTIGLSAWIISVFKRAPFIFNVQEIYPDLAVNMGMLKNKGLIWALEQLEMFTYWRSTRISVISERFRQQLLKKGVRDHKIEIIPNFVDTSFIQPGPRVNQFSAENNLNEKFVVLYAGNIGLTQSFETVLEAAQNLVDNPDIQFVIVGDGTRRQWIEEQLADLKLPNVLLLDYQPRSMVPCIYATGDLCVVPLKHSMAIDTFPSKIYTIMAAARPVVAAAHPESELSDLVQRADCGWVVPPDNTDRLTEAIVEAHADRQLARARGQRGHDYVRANYSKETVTEQYHQLLTQVGN